MRYSVSTVLPLLFGAVLLVGACASTQSPMRAASGTWSYTVHGTPEGDVDGSLVLSAQGGMLSGEFTSELTSSATPLDPVVLEGQTLTFSAAVDIDGQQYNTTTTAQITGDNMEGTMDVDGVGTYRFTATRAGT